MHFVMSIICYTVVICIGLAAFPVSVSAGSCWTNYNPVTGRCISLMYRNTSQSDCCLREGFSYTKHVLTYEDIFREIIDEGGVPHCIPCTSFNGDVCFNIECGRDQMCVDRHGQPRCRCHPDCYGDMSDNPVCGTNGKVFKNECYLRMFRCRNNLDIEVAYPGACRDSCKNIQCIEDRVCIEDIEDKPHCIDCRSSCTEDELGKSVCGSDGNTYESRCHLRLTSCSSEIFLEINRTGNCAGPVTCSNFRCMEGNLCTMDNRIHKPRCFSCELEACHLDPARAIGPICGRDNQTYASYCEMNRRICKTGIYMESKHIGFCSNSPLSINELEAIFRQYISLFKQDLSHISTSQLANRLGIDEKEVEELLLQDVVTTSQYDRN